MTAVEAWNPERGNWSLSDEIGYTSRIRTLGYLPRNLDLQSPLHAAQATLRRFLLVVGLTGLRSTPILDGDCGRSPEIWWRPQDAHSARSLDISLGRRASDSRGRSGSSAVWSLPREGLHPPATAGFTATLTERCGAARWPRGIPRVRSEGSADALPARRASWSLCQP